MGENSKQTQNFWDCNKLSYCNILTNFSSKCHRLRAMTENGGEWRAFEWKAIKMFQLYSLQNRDVALMHAPLCIIYSVSFCQVDSSTQPKQFVN